MLLTIFIQHVISSTYLMFIIFTSAKNSHFENKLTLFPNDVIILSNYIYIKLYSYSNIFSLFSGSVERCNFSSLVPYDKLNSTVTIHCALSIVFISMMI